MKIYPFCIIDIENVMKTPTKIILNTPEASDSNALEGIGVPHNFRGILI